MLKDATAPRPVTVAQSVIRLDAGFLEDVLDGLGQAEKTLPAKYFYDERGSRLFDEICELEEYYPTRTETSLLARHAGAIAEQVGKGVTLLELGSGSSTKVRLLLDRLDEPAAYIPVDISKEHLEASAARLAADYPGLKVKPVFADYVQGFPLTVEGGTGAHARLLPRFDDRKFPSRRSPYLPGASWPAVGSRQQAADRCGPQEIQVSGWKPPTTTRPA